MSLLNFIRKSIRGIQPVATPVNGSVDVLCNVLKKVYPSDHEEIIKIFTPILDIKEPEEFVSVLKLAERDDAKQYLVETFLGKFSTRENFIDFLTEEIIPILISTYSSSDVMKKLIPWLPSVLTIDQIRKLTWNKHNHTDYRLLVHIVQEGKFTLHPSDLQKDDKLAQLARDILGKNSNSIFTQAFTRMGVPEEKITQYQKIREQHMEEIEKFIQDHTISEYGRDVLFVQYDERRMPKTEVSYMENMIEKIFLTNHFSGQSSSHINTLVEWKLSRRTKISPDLQTLHS